MELVGTKIFLFLIWHLINVRGDCTTELFCSGRELGCVIQEECSVLPCQFTVQTAEHFVQIYD